MEEEIKNIQKEIEELQFQKSKLDDKIGDLNQKVLYLYSTEQKRLSLGLGEYFDL